MKFFKIITYVFLIGFIIDLIGDLFNFEKLNDDLKFIGKKASITLIVYVMSISFNIVLVKSETFSTILWWLLIPFIASFVYFLNQHLTNKQESES